MLIVFYNLEWMNIVELIRLDANSGWESLDALIKISTEN